DPLVRMQVDGLEAQRNEAVAMQQQAVTAVASAKAQVAARESDLQAARAAIVQAETELDSAQRRLARSEKLSGQGAASLQQLDDDRARVRNAHAAVSAARARAGAAEAAINAARAQVTGAEAAVN